MPSAPPVGQTVLWVKPPHTVGFTASHALLHLAAAWDGVWRKIADTASWWVDIYIKLDNKRRHYLYIRAREWTERGSGRTDQPGCYLRLRPWSEGGAFLGVCLTGSTVSVVFKPWLVEITCYLTSALCSTSTKNSPTPSAVDCEALRGMFSLLLLQ